MLTYKVFANYTSHQKKKITTLSWLLFSSVSSFSDKKHGRHSRELSKEDFLEFKSILLYYIDFCQKQKVCKYTVQKVCNYTIIIKRLSR